MKVLTIGEPLLVFKSQDIDKSLQDAENYKKYFAGAELNVCVGLSNLNIETKYLTQLGDDGFGKSLLEFLKDKKIDVTGVKLIENESTGIYFKNNVTTGDPEIKYYRKNSAASFMTESIFEDLNFDEIDYGHFTGIMAGISDSCAKSLKQLMITLKDKNKTNVFDPNIRKQLWENENVMRETLNDLAKNADIVVPGIGEGLLLANTSDPEEIADFYLNQSDVTKLVVVKLGEKGAYFKEKGKQGSIVKGFKVEKVIDTVGAGDGFAVGLISGLIKGFDTNEAVRRACAIGAMAVMHEGDNDGYPDEEKLQEFMKGELNE